MRTKLGVHLSKVTRVLGFRLSRRLCTWLCGRLGGPSIVMGDLVASGGHAFGYRITPFKAGARGLALAISHIRFVSIEIDTVQIDIRPVG